MSRGNLARSKRYECDPEAEYEMDLLWGQPVRFSKTRAVGSPALRRIDSTPSMTSSLVKVAMNEAEGALFVFSQGDPAEGSDAEEHGGDSGPLFTDLDESGTKDTAPSSAPGFGESLILDCEEEAVPETQPLKLRLGDEESRRGKKKPMPSLPAPGEIAQLGVRRPGMAPRRIGKGKLVQSRLTWKPGDPFGVSKDTPALRFRWELMLTSASLTAACGLVCVWLLHSIFA